MLNGDDCAVWTNDERFREVARILAAGVLRLHRRAALTATADHPDNLANSSPAGLEVGDGTVLSVHTG